jgi:hypothetical protein
MSHALRAHFLSYLHGLESKVRSSNQQTNGLRRYLQKSEFRMCAYLPEFVPT